MAYGASKSTTLIPVTKISCSTLISTNSGASAWMGATLSVGMGPLSSMGSPEKNQDMEVNVKSCRAQVATFQVFSFTAGTSFFF